MVLVYVTALYTTDDAFRLISQCSLLHFQCYFKFSPIICFSPSLLVVQIIMNGPAALLVIPLISSSTRPDSGGVHRKWNMTMSFVEERTWNVMAFTVRLYPADI